MKAMTIEGEVGSFTGGQIQWHVPNMTHFMILINFLPTKDMNLDTISLQAKPELP